MKIKAVLLVPEKGDRHGLLREGPCGARPPMATPNPMCPGHWQAHAWPGPCCVSGAPHALVLAWDGEPVAEGLFALRKVGLENISTIPAIDWPDGTVRLPAWVYSFDHLVKWCGRFDRWGTLVLLDAEGREVDE